MRYLLIVVTTVLLSCEGAESPESIGLNFTDPYRGNFKGEPEQIELLKFVFDSTGSLVPDSAYSELGEWKDKYLRNYTEYDSSKKTKMFAVYSYYPNGLSKGMYVDSNGRRIHSFEVSQNVQGRDSTFVEFGQGDKLVFYYTDLVTDSNGNMLSARQFGPDSILTSLFEAKYEGKVLKSSIIRDSSGKIQSTYSAAFKDGDEVADTTVLFDKNSATTSIRQYTYQGYDSLKNWLQKTELDATGKPIKVIKRKITYANKVGNISY